MFVYTIPPLSATLIVPPKERQLPCVQQLPDWTKILQLYTMYVYASIHSTMPHLVTNCHICLADIVCVPQIRPLVPIHQCQSMKSLDSVCCHAATERDVVLRTCSHVLQKLTELLSLCLTGKSVFSLVGLTINILKIKSTTHKMMCFIWNILQTLS